MRYTIKIKNGLNEDMWLWRTYPHTQFVCDQSVALRMSIEQCSRESNYLMQIGISHQIEQVNI